MILSEMKNPERQHDYDDPSIDFTNFDSPSAPKTLESSTDEDIYLSMERFNDDSSSDESESVEQDHVFYDVEDDMDFQYVVEYDEGEDDVFHDAEDDIDSQHVVEDSEEEYDVFHDVEDDIDSEHHNLFSFYTKKLVEDDEEQDDVFHDAEDDLDCQHVEDNEEEDDVYHDVEDVINSQHDNEEEDAVFHDVEEDFDFVPDNLFSSYTMKLVEDDEEKDDVFHDVEDDLDSHHVVDDEEEEDDVYHGVEDGIVSQQVGEDDAFPDVDDDVVYQHVVKDEKEEDYVLHDVKSDLLADAANFDSPSPVKNTGNKLDGGDEVSDILSNLSSKLEFLSIEKRNCPIKQPSSSSNSFIKENINEHTPEEISECINVENSFSSASKENINEHTPEEISECINAENSFSSASKENINEHTPEEISECINVENSFSSASKENINEHTPEEISEGINVESSFSSASKEYINEHTLEENSECINVKNSVSFASNLSNSSLKAHASRKEHDTNDHVMSLTKTSLSMESFISIQKNQNDEDDDCVVTSGQNFVPKAMSRPGKLVQESDDSSAVYTLIDESCDSTSEVEVPFSFGHSKLKFYLPSEIANKLYPHQLQGLKWLWSLHCKGKGGILGDETGLGKTMQICGFLAGLFHSNLIKRVLVVVPKRLLPHWMKELSMVNLSGKTRVYFGRSTRARQYGLQYILQDKGVILTTYDIVPKNVKALSGNYDEVKGDALTWDYVILDEGHLIKNPTTQRAKSLHAIPCAHRIIISGIPLQNNLKELWALFKFCCPELLGDKKCFKDKYESAILRGNGKKASDRDKRIGSAVAQDLRNCIQPYFLCRLKNEVFHEDGGTDTAKLKNEVFHEDGGTDTAKLSKKSEIIVWLKLSSCQRKLYEAFLNSDIVLSAFDCSPLSAIMTLKKICDHPLLLTKRAAEDVLEGMESGLNEEDHGVAKKLGMHIADLADKYDIQENHNILSCKISFIVSLLDNLIPEGHNVLIFSETCKMLNLIQDTLNARGYKFLRIDGTTKACDRLKIVNAFQEGAGAPIFLLTSQACGLGRSLTKANHVIVVDPAWNPMFTDSQSVEHAYCNGQTEDVLVYHLVTCGTMEEKIYRKQVDKGGLFRSDTEHKEQLRYFSQQELRELFSFSKQGLDVSVTQQPLHGEHDCEHTMDPSLKLHIKYLESLGIAGISHHNLLFSRTASVPVVADDELTK